MQLGRICRSGSRPGTFCVLDTYGRLVPDVDESALRAYVQYQETWSADHIYRAVWNGGNDNLPGLLQWGLVDDVVFRLEIIRSDDGRYLAIPKLRGSDTEYSDEPREIYPEDGVLLEGVYRFPVATVVVTSDRWSV